MFTLGLVQENSSHDIYDVLFIKEIIYMIIKIKRKFSHQTQRVNLSGLVFIVEIIGV